MPPLALPSPEEELPREAPRPRGDMDVSYKVDPKAEQRLFPEMFPGRQNPPLTTTLGEMATGENF